MRHIYPLMTQPMPSDIDVLYTMSNQLVQAETPQQQLEAVSDYARRAGASQGVLFYIENPQQRPIQWLVVGAEWLTDDKHRLGVGARFENAQMQFVQHLLSYPVRATLVEDMFARADVDPPMMAIFQAHHVQAAAILPLSNNGHWIGMLWFTWDRPHSFTHQDHQIYTTMLQYTAPVIDSRRLLEQMQRRALELEAINHELNLLYRTAEVINSANTYAEVVEAVAHFDTEAEVVSLMLWEQLDWASANYIDIVVVIDRKGVSAIQPGDHLPKSSFPVAHLMLGERVWIFEDTLNDPRVDDHTRQNWGALDILSFFGTALYINQRWLGGVTFHSSRPRSYTERQKRLLAGVGDLVLAAIERIRLKQESEAAMQTFAVLEERNRLARELHDSVSQALYGIVLSVKAAQLQRVKAPDHVVPTLDYALSLSQAALSEMRALIFELRPETLEKEGLREALHRQAEMIKARYDLQVDCHMDTEPSIALHTKEHIYWIAREALHNVIKHARADRVELALNATSDQIDLRISDDGIGFDTTREYLGHLGLKSMFERTERIHGRLTITSQPHSGTTIHLQAPA